MSAATNTPSANVSRDHDRTSATEPAPRMALGDRIGLAMRPRMLSAVLVRRDGSVAARAHLRTLATTPNTADIECVLDSLIGTTSSRAPMFRPPVHLALSPSFVQHRRLDGLSEMRDVGALTRLLTENPASFFLYRDQPVLLGGIHAAANGVVWAAAYDAHPIEAARIVARRRGSQLRTVIPTSTVLRPTNGDNVEIEWSDGTTSIVAHFRDRQLEKLVRRTVGVADGARDVHDDHPISSMITMSRAEIEMDAIYFDAYGAVTQRHAGVRWESPRAWPAYLRTIRQTAACVALLANLAWLLAGPALRDLRIARRAEIEIARTGRRAQAAQRDEKALRQRNELIGRARSFARRRVPAFDVIATLTDILPDSSAVASFHIDSMNATAILIARHATDAISELQNQATLGSVEIASPVTREQFPTGEMERVTVRFKLPSSVQSTPRRLPPSATPPATAAPTPATAGL